MKLILKLNVFFYASKQLYLGLFFLFSLNFFYFSKILEFKFFFIFILEIRFYIFLI